MSASRSTDSPRSLPSRSAATLIRCHWSRPWCTVMLPSLRDSVHLPAADLTGDQQGQHFLGRHLQFRAEATAHVRRDHPEVVLRDAGDQGQHVPQHVRDLVDDHSVYSSPSFQPTTARGSMALGISRCWR